MKSFKEWVLANVSSRQFGKTLDQAYGNYALYVCVFSNQVYALFELLQV